MLRTLAVTGGARRAWRLAGAESHCFSSEEEVVELGKSFNLDQAKRRTRLEAILSGRER